MHVLFILELVTILFFIFYNVYFVKWIFFKRGINNIFVLTLEKKIKEELIIYLKSRTKNQS